MKIFEDRYNGVTVDSSTLPQTKDLFEKEICELLNSLKDKKLLWIKIPIDKSDFIPILTNLDFEFHHCDNQELMLLKRLIDDPVIPPSKNFTVGVGAIVRDGGMLLVIKDRFSVGYKLPGGHIDNNENIKDALQREVYEETGVEVEFESIVNVGHFTKGQFGESNLYIVCTAKVITKDINVYDCSEIIEAKWIDIQEFLEMEETNNYNRDVVKTAMGNRELKLVDKDLKLKIPSGYEIFS